LLFNQKKQAQPKMMILKTTDGDDSDYWRRCWLIKQGNDRPMVYEERDRSLFCNCGAHYNDCEHKQLVIQTVKKELKILNECGSQEAMELQNRLNNDNGSRNDNGNGAQAPSQTMKLDLSNPFEESEQYDIDQIEGRRDGEVTWKLRNGEYVISYKGIMTLAEKHHITFDEAVQRKNKLKLMSNRLKVATASANCRWIKSSGRGWLKLTELRKKSLAVRFVSSLRVSKIQAS
jgi:hypothetical protein